MEANSWNRTGLFASGLSQASCDMPVTLINCYKAIEDGSVRMLEAAKSQDWDSVVRCEGDCALLIEQLRSQARHEELDDIARHEKSRIMRRILLIDAQIRLLAEPWLEHFQHHVETRPNYLH